MKSTYGVWTRVVLAASLAALLPGFGLATPSGGAPGPTAQKADAPAPAATETKHLTGCIRRGDAEDQYKFMTTDGAQWDIAGTNAPKTPGLKVGKYTDNKVAVTARATPNPLDPNSKKATAGILVITQIKVLSKTCES